MKTIYYCLIFLSPLIMSCSGKDNEEIPVVEPAEYRISSSGGFTIHEDLSIVATSDGIIRLKSDLKSISEQLPQNIVAQLKTHVIVAKYTSGSNILTISNDQIVINGVNAYYNKVILNEPMLLLKGMAMLYYDKYASQAVKTNIETSYLSAIGSGKYDKVYSSNGVKLSQNQTPAAKSDKREYFAELTEAYWGDNNFYPFDYQELQRYDAAGFALMESIWGVRTIAPNSNGITMPPVTLTQFLANEESPLDLYYRKYINADGLHVVSSRFVSDAALVQAKLIINMMLENVPETKTVFTNYKIRVGIVGYRENITDMPECRLWNTWWPGTNWDTRGRGYGATEWVPLMTCGEENIIKTNPNVDWYTNESIMVHEFAHNVDFALRRTRSANFTSGTAFENALILTFNNAKSKGLWQGTYSMENNQEYFAEGAQAWFNTCRMVVAINGVNTKLKTREQLKNYDVELYNLLDKIFPKTVLTGYHFDYE